MKKQKINFNHKNKKISLEVLFCSLFEMAKGLMFTRREKARALLFEFEKPVKMKIHSWYVFYSFLAIWLDDKNKLIDFKIVKPFTFAVRPKKSFNKLIEIPINKRYKKEIGFLVGEQKI